MLKESGPVRPRVYLLIDQSGSMESRWAETRKSVDAYVAGLRETDPLVTAVTFRELGGPKIKVFPTVLASEWRGFDVSPNGGTPLYDAISTVAQMALDAGAPRTAVVIITDGYENASRTTSRAGAKDWLDRCRARDWEVLFLGADFDAFPQAMELGATYGKVLNTTRGWYGEGLVGASASTQSYFDAGTKIEFDDQLRARATGKAA